MTALVLWSDENWGETAMHWVAGVSLDVLVLKEKCHLCCFICNDEFIQEPERV